MKKAAGDQSGGLTFQGQMANPRSTKEKYSNFSNRSLLVLAITAAICSRAMFAFFHDPEGPNLLVVTGMAAVIYIFSAIFYLSKALPALTGQMTFGGDPPAANHRHGIVPGTALRPAATRHATSWHKGSGRRLFACGTCLRAVFRRFLPAAAQGLEQMHSRRAVGEHHLHQRILGREQSLLRLQHRQQVGVQRALAILQLGNLEGLTGGGDQAAQMLF